MILTPLFTYKLTLAYCGTNYLGWQIQTKGDTVQGQLEKALQEISHSKEISVLGSGRTDTGVHSLAQVAKVQIPLDLAPAKLKLALNSLLPEDIQVLSAESAPSTFHPIGEVHSKEYVYLFTNLDRPLPLLRTLVSNCSFPLDLVKMEEALPLFQGRHDFAFFSTKGSAPKTTVREIFKVSLQSVHEVDPKLPFLPSVPIYRVSFEGTGFLKQMVRLMVGSLWLVGRGKLQGKDIELALSGKKALAMKLTAPPEGLYMNRVSFQNKVASTLSLR